LRRQIFPVTGEKGKEGKDKVPHTASFAVESPLTRNWMERWY